MAQLTKRHRVIIERHLNRTKQRERRIIMSRGNTRTTDVSGRGLRKVVHRAAQPTKCEPESDSEKSET